MILGLKILWNPPQRVSVLLGACREYAADVRLDVLATRRTKKSTRRCFSKWLQAKYAASPYAQGANSY